MITQLVAAMVLGGSATAAEPEPLCISGVYPHLAVFSKEGEVGIGAVVPWAGRLWMITYPPHMPKGGPDKLYTIDPDMTRRVRPESVGGTHANRLIHRESGQLIIGPYFVDAAGHVRACDLNKLTGRMTATARHLTDPAHKVYFFDMEGPIYEVDVRTLDVRKLFGKPVPGWHGKGGYTGGGRFVISNNGEWVAGQEPARYDCELPPKSPEDAGALAEWDGHTWRVVERRQFTEVTGPGGLLGAPDDHAPLWAVGWDRRSVLLKLLDGGQWSRFRLPKASHAMDPIHGWYTEWPRIREVGDGRYLMTMHHMLFEFPGGFRNGATGGIKPIASHLRYIPDFCEWNGRLVLASDDASLMQNPMCGTSQSNLWFGTWEQLRGFGPRSGWGGPWLDDTVTADVPSDPFLVNGYDRAVLHLRHQAATTVQFRVEVDQHGHGQWSPLTTIAVPAGSYRYQVFADGIAANWVRLVADQACVATAYFHLTGNRTTSQDRPKLFAGLAKPDDPAICGLIRPAAHNHNLQVAVDGLGYREVDEHLAFTWPVTDRGQEVAQVAAIKPQFTVEPRAAVMQLKQQRYLLPKGHRGLDNTTDRCIREVESERFLVNVCGTLYEMPRDDGLPLIRPICTHNRRLHDFCTWRGLLTISGVRVGAQPDGHVFCSSDGQAALWFGGVDDLWQLGKPVGHGGPWLQTAVQAGAASDPYLMTGFDHKRLELSHDSDQPVTVTVEVDTDHRSWCVYQRLTVAPRQLLTHDFAAGYSAHWVRFRADRACTATAQLSYR